MAKIYISLVFSLLALALIGTVSSGYINCLGVRELSKQDKNFLVNLHNQLREKTAAGLANGQPPAQNMRQLSWDEHAAKQASDWAGTCKIEHNQPTDQDGNPLGQNIAARGASGKVDLSAKFKEWVNIMVNSWYNEVNLYTFGSGFAFSTGHYTQMVWAKTVKVGCGYSYYDEIDEYGTTWKSGYLVCNYNPAGNYENQLEPYESGNVNCEAFNLETSSKFSHLCVKKKKKH